MTDLLYHYTGEDGIKGIFDSQCLWATRYDCLNDTQEIQHLIKHINKFKNYPPATKKRAAFCDFLKEAIQESFLGKKSSKAEFFVTCFSDDQDSHIMWENIEWNLQYAICFNKLALNRLVASEDNYALGTEPVYQVMYDDINKLRTLKAWEDEFNHVINGNMDDNGLRGILAHRAVCLPALFKNPDPWKSQREWRIILRRPIVENLSSAGKSLIEGKKIKEVYDNGKSYIKLFEDNPGLLNNAVNSIIIGPQGKREVVDEIVKSHHLTNITVKYSEWWKEKLVA